MNLGAANASFLGQNEGDYAGFSIAGVGDVNGDGLDDFLIGAPGYNPGGKPSAGKVYLIYGNGSLHPDTSLAMANASFNGENSNDFLGSEVAGAGDVNGDGYDDILLSARGFGSNTGKVYLIYGNRSLKGSIDLASTGASFIGETVNDRAGTSISRAGDVNRDGYDDILIGAYGYNESFTDNRGKAYLIYGNRSLNPNMGLGAANASFIGENEGDQAGDSVTGVGDINRDGFADIAIAADAYNDGSNDDAGKVYIILGNGSLPINMNLGAANASFIGETDNNYAGLPVVGAGDINRDGYDDIILSAHMNNAATGKAYVVYGNGSLQQNMNLGAANASYIGESTNNWAGGALAGRADVNGDGNLDLLVSARGYDTSDDNNIGKIYLVLGPKYPENGNASFLGESAGDYAGYSMANVGDVNGDGCEDIILGSSSYDDGSNADAGKIYLFYGNRSLPLNLNLASANASFVGETASAYAGQSVAGAGDVNGDGMNDILIGAWGSQNAAGKIYIIYGNRSLHPNMSLAAANASFSGEIAFSRTGYSVASAGDVNHDGFDDILIGAPMFNSNQGKAYLVYGNRSLHQNMGLGAANASFVGETSTDEAGGCVAGAGDVNRDGYDDIIIGAVRPGGSAGKIFLVYGNGSLNQNMGLGAANASFVGEGNLNYAGFSVAGAGDVNRDGYDDILVGAYGYGSNTGKAYLIYGNGSLHQNMGLGAANTSFIGENTNDYAGIAVAGAGDFNRDGYDDILVGAYGYGGNKGKVYLIYGNGFLYQNMGLGEANKSLLGENVDDYYGFSIASAGDIDGNGHDDILVAAYGFLSGTGTGKGYLYCDLESPARIADLVITTPTSDGFTLTWTAPGDDGWINTITGYLLKYSTNPITEGNFDLAITYNTAGWANLKTGGNAESRILTGLAQDTTYYFALKAFDNVPYNSTMSNVVNGKTLDATAPGLIDDLSVNIPTYSGFTLNWTAPGDNVGIGTVAGYILKYSTQLITAMNFDSALTCDTSGWTILQPGGSQEGRVVTGLAEGTTYYFALKAFDEVPNNSTVSSYAFGTTLDSSSPIISGPSDIEFSEGDGGSWILSWTVTDPTIMNPTYTITINGGTPTTPASWSSGQPITIDATAWTAGSYTVVLWVNDGFGHVVTDTVLVVVNPREFPVWLIPVIIAGIIGGAVIVFIFWRKKVNRKTQDTRIKSEKNN